MPLRYEIDARIALVKERPRALGVAMDIHHIRYFLAVCETRNFTRAATKDVMHSALVTIQQTFGTSERPQEDIVDE